MSGRAWKGHDLRDRTIRLVHYGLKMMEGGYRLLWLHPYRGRS
ncbi:MAG: DNA -binding domain-containing protein [Methylocella sp.]